MWVLEIWIQILFLHAPPSIGFNIKGCEHTQTLPRGLPLLSYQPCTLQIVSQSYTFPPKTFQVFFRYYFSFLWKVLWSCLKQKQLLPIHRIPSFVSWNLRLDSPFCSRSQLRSGGWLGFSPRRREEKDNSATSKSIMALRRNTQAFLGFFLLFLLSKQHQRSCLQKKRSFKLRTANNTKKS